MTRAPPRATGARDTRRASTIALIALFAGLSSGCSSLPFWRDETTAAAEPKPEPLVALYEVEVDAPGALRALLVDHLDLTRFREAPAGDAVSAAELDRLAAAAPAQARALLETEGYFNAEVTVAREPGTGALPRLRVTVVPGPRVVVARVDLTATSPPAPRSQGRETPGVDRLETLRRNWPLRPGFPFRQDAWAAAKVATLNQLRVDGHPVATLRDSQARIDAVDNRAELSLVVDPGPLYRLGGSRIDGLERYDEAAVRRLATFSPGTAYSEQVLLDWQERLLKVGLFEGATVEIDPAAGNPDAATVLVTVREMTEKQATFGVGFSADTGPRASVEYVDRKLFGQRLISRSKIEHGADLKTLGSELSTWPLEGGWRHLVSASLERLRAVDEVRNAWSARVGRARETSRIDRLYSIDATHAQLQSAPYSTSATAALVNFGWLRRDLDSVLSPTDGTTIATQVGLGHGSGRRTIPGVDEERSKSPFLRVYGRVFWYRPVGDWFASARVEAGEVVTKSAVAIPDTLLFRAGGDDSVRGYAFRSLGPKINGAVASGRVLATGSVEIAHVITARLPSLLGAVFVDAGNAADRWADLRPVFGTGVGLRYRSPVGPLKLDFAYGHDVHRVRVHFSVGVVF